MRNGRATVKFEEGRLSASIKPMTTSKYTAIVQGGCITLLGYGSDEVSRRANAISTIKELWPELKLLQLQATTDW